MMKTIGYVRLNALFMLFNQLTLFILAVFSARLMTTTQYGLVTVLNSIVQLSMLISLLGIPQLIPRLYQEKKNIQLSKILFIASFISLFVCILLNNLSQGRYIILLYAATVFSCAGNVMICILQAQKRFLTFFLVNLILMPLPFIFLLLFYFTEQFVFVLLGIPSTAIINFLVYLFVTKIPRYKEDLKLKETLRFSLPLWLSSILSSVTSRFDVMIPAFIGLSSVAYYSLASGLVRIPINVVTSSNFITISKISEFYKQKKKDLIRISLKTIYIGTALIMTPIMIFLVVSPESIISLLFTDKFLTDSTVSLIRIMSLMLFTMTVRSLLGPHVIASLKTRIALEATTFASILTLFLSFTFLNAIGILAIGIAVTISLFFDLFYAIFSLRKIKTVDVGLKTFFSSFMFFILNYTIMLGIIQIQTSILIKLLCGLFIYSISVLIIVLKNDLWRNTALRLFPIHI